MRIRGERACRDCGTEWSYYETGSVNCPSCGSVRSRGLDEERTLHTAANATLDLTEARDVVDERPLADVADAARAACREFVRRDVFVRGGELVALDDTHLAARELAHAADLVGRSRDVDEDADLYLLDLLRGADAGERPDPDAVPDSLRAARGLAAAEGVRAYRRELRDWLDDHPRSGVREPLGRLDQHAKRVLALGGEVDPVVAERLVGTARALGRYCREGEEAALATAADRLDALDDAGAREGSGLEEG